MSHNYTLVPLEALRNGSMDGIETQGGVLDSTKPREERDMQEIYGDLDETAQLPTFVVSEKQENGEKQEFPEEQKIGTKQQPAEGTSALSGLKRPVFRQIAEQGKRHQEFRFSKSLTDYGFKNPTRASQKRPYETYVRQFGLPEGESLEELLQRKRIHVEYDLDEQDQLYLQNRNNRPDSVLQLSEEVFEIMITVLENEWSDLEKKMASIASGDDDSHTRLTLDQGLDNNKYGNDDGIVLGSVADQKCAVCNDSDCDNSNAIVFCDGCDIAVHQECYGIAFIPEGQWLCRKCMINKDRETSCVFCPSRTGAFKQMDNSLWSHVVCALWIHELYFANPIYMEPIEGVDLIPKSRWKLTCYICKQRIGACIQCSNKNCFQAYHVTCAKRAGLYMEMSGGVQAALTNKNTLRSYCDRHSPAGWDYEEVLAGVARTRQYYRDMRILADKNAQLTHSQKTANRLNVFKWHTENHTPIAPKKFSDKLYETLLRLRVDAQESPNDQAKQSMLRGLGQNPLRSREQTLKEIRTISNEVCAYWCLKREYKKGAPLVRKNNNLIAMSSIVYGDNNHEELERKIEVADVLLGDVEHVIKLAGLTVDRQQLEQQRSDAQLASADAVFFPIQRLLAAHVSSLEDSDLARVLHRYTANAASASGDDQGQPGAPGGRPLGWDDIKRNVAAYQYSSVAQLDADIVQLHAAITTEHKSNALIARMARKLLRRHQNRMPSLLASERHVRRACEPSTGVLQAPFVTTKGSSVEFKPYDPLQALRAHSLSPVDDVSSTDWPLLNDWLHGR
ncbi:Piso0_001682 [Millerozyma farinosa CBS 7064]|uniref:Piso0_001682 protein n=1 Tax=Pichia sorbitophila (strain ATCC MYA-4447 / BCRC 22081 / CBS 7064 / NBRC 10061 / NRRL Y-12695) TaxID=559304 RepID=G8YNT7_PICSO|nr:Piso0_001682 [Millerozyma farinosa CBS 7064]